MPDYLFEAAQKIEQAMLHAIRKNFWDEAEQAAVLCILFEQMRENGCDQLSGKNPILRKRRQRLGAAMRSPS